MIVQGRFFPEYDRDVLDLKSRAVLAKIALQLQHALGLSASPPFQKDKLIEWITQQQKSNKNERSHESILLQAGLNGAGKRPESQEQGAASTASSTPSLSRDPAVRGGESYVGLIFDGLGPTSDDRDFCTTAKEMMARKQHVYQEKPGERFADSARSISKLRSLETLSADHHSRNQELKADHHSFKTESLFFIFCRTVREAIMGLQEIDPLDMDATTLNFVLHRYRPGEVVVSEGDVISDVDASIFILTKGSLHLYESSVEVARATEYGEVVGQLAFLYSFPSRYTIVADNDVELWGLARRHLPAALREQVRQRGAASAALLRELPLLKDAPRQALESLMQHMDLRLFDKGEFVVREGEPGKYFCVVEEGECVACSNLHSPDYRIHKRLTKAGDALGEEALVHSGKEDVRYAYNVVVESRRARIMMFEQASLRKCVGEIVATLVREPGGTLGEREDGRTLATPRASALKSSTPRALAARAQDAGREHNHSFDYKSLRMRTHMSDEVHAVLGSGSETTAAEPSPRAARTLSKAERLGCGRQPWRQERAKVSQLLAESHLSGVDKLSPQDLDELAGTMMVHATEAEDVLCIAGKSSGSAPRVYVMMCSGGLGLYRKMKTRRHARAKNDLTRSDYGTRFSLYKPCDVFALALLPLNDAPSPYTLLCEGFGQVVSLDRRVATRLFHGESQARRETCARHLRCIDLLRDLDDKEIMQLVDMAQTYHVRLGDLLLRRGEEASSLYLVEEGRVALRAEDGAEVGTRREGECFFAAALLEVFHSFPVTEDVIVTSPEAVVISIDRADFRRTIGKLLLRADPRAFATPGAATAASQRKTQAGSVASAFRPPPRLSSVPLSAAFRPRPTTTTGGSGLASNAGSEALPAAGSSV